MSRAGDGPYSFPDQAPQLPQQCWSQQQSSHRLGMLPSVARLSPGTVSRALAGSASVWPVAPSYDGLAKAKPNRCQQVGKVVDATRAQQVNRVSSIVLIVLSLVALLDVLLLGYTQPPLPDEGTGAHIFQLSIVALVPTGLLFLATSDWTQPVRTLRRLAFPAAVVVLAFAALYYLEHFRG